MAEHMQQQIVQALQITLRLAGTDAQDRVRVDGLDLLPVSDCPALELTVGDESVEPISHGRAGAATQQRDLKIEVACLVSGSRDYRPRAAELLAQVEEALASRRPTVLDGLLARRPRLLGTRPQPDGQGAEAVYAIRSMWAFRYFTAEGAPRGPASV
jgi:hypothetical protein